MKAKKILILKDDILKNFLEVTQIFWKILVYNIYVYCHLLSFSFCRRNFLFSQKLTDSTFRSNCIKIVGRTPGVRLTPKIPDSTAQVEMRDNGKNPMIHS